MATFSERLAELNNDPDVLEAVTRSEPAPVSGFVAIWSATITYVSVSGNVARENTVALVGIDHGGPGEAWYWSRGVPDVLTNDPVKYMSGRTAGGWSGLSGAAQASAIEGFCNEVYEAAVDGALPIREFQVQPVKSDTVRVSGYFQGADDSWAQQQWFVRLIDPNGSVAAPYTNVQFQRITG